MFDRLDGKRLERVGQVVEAGGDDRHVRGGDAVGDGPPLARAEQDQAEPRKIGLEREDADDVARALDVDDERLAPVDDGDERLGIGARVEILVVADLAAAVAAKSCASTRAFLNSANDAVRLPPAFSGAALAELDDLEGARPDEDVEAVAQADERALPGEDVAARRSARRRRG